MDNFRFNAYTNILFGKGEINKLPAELDKFGKNVLLVYGGGSIKKNGIYDTVKNLLTDFNIFELSGVEPNPRITTVREGVKICKDNNIDVVLAVGGGSVIDCSKLIAAGSYYSGDAWDLVLDSSLIKNVLPIVVVLTVAATGSEMNKNAVITNWETKQKLCASSMDMIPKAAVCDPTYLYSLSPIQTAAATADILSHLFENYFKKDTSAFVQDRISEGLMKACFKYCPIAMKEPNNYEARANLMFASTMALNGLTGAGKEGVFSCHPIEHELSAFYDITHGIGLAILTPRWLKYILDENTAPKICEYGCNVLGISCETDAFECAEQAIEKTYNFFKECGIPMTLAEVGIDDRYFDEMAENAVKNGRLSNAFKALSKRDVVNILKMCL